MSSKTFTPDHYDELFTSNVEVYYYRLGDYIQTAHAQGRRSVRIEPGARRTIYKVTFGNLRKIHIYTFVSGLGESSRTDIYWDVEMDRVLSYLPMEYRARIDDHGHVTISW